jgi:hypothetical protein
MAVRLEPAGRGARITQEYAVLSLPVIWEKIIALMIPEHRDPAGRAARRPDAARSRRQGRPMSVS